MTGLEAAEGLFVNDQSYIPGKPKSQAQVRF